VSAGGTIVNLLAGAIFLRVAKDRGRSPNTRYFFWIPAAMNLLPGAGYFLYSGISGFGDWQEVIRGLPHQNLLRTVMTIFGIALCVYVARLLGTAVSPFCSTRTVYSIVGRLPYVHPANVILQQNQ
jgi:hypothetical protein